MIAMTDSSANIHLARQATQIIAPVLMDNEIKARLTDGRIVESTHIAKLQLPGLSRLVIQIHISPKI